jgi:hypothetical protein
LFQKPVEKKNRRSHECIKRSSSRSRNKHHLGTGYPKNLSSEEAKLVILKILNNLERCKPDKSFEKFKVRVLNRGDKEKNTGETVKGQ